MKIPAPTLSMFVTEFAAGPSQTHEGVIAANFVSGNLLVACLFPADKAEQIAEQIKRAGVEVSAPKSALVVAGSIPHDAAKKIASTERKMRGGGMPR